MKRANYIQVDMDNAIMCSELEDLARRVGILIKGAEPKAFTITLQSLRKDLLAVSEMIKQGKTWKE